MQQVLEKEINPSSLKPTLKIALIGNPNCGKSTLFNVLTGLNQRTGNFPGVTVDKKTGTLKLDAKDRTIQAEVIDLPGTYSLYPKSLDEKIAFEVLCDPENKPDLTIIVADASNLRRSLFLCSQIIDLKIPAILALNMMDIVEKQNVKINIEALSETLGIKVIPINARKRLGIPLLKEALADFEPTGTKQLVNISELGEDILEQLKNALKTDSSYNALIIASNYKALGYSKERKENISALIKNLKFDPKKFQAKETVRRYEVNSAIISSCTNNLQFDIKDTLSYKADKLLTHKVLGFVFFLIVLFLVFQSIFTWSAYPMELIDQFFAVISSSLADVLPKGIFSDLLINGILAGISGVVIFIPQLVLLFAFIAILEDTGYMARVSFIMDKLMRKFGLNGRSVIPLISGMACAVPAIMSARTISNWKERMITIMVTPLMSCSARLPVYTLLIALVVPSDKSWLGFNMQGIALMGLYLVGFVAVLASAFIMKVILKATEKSYFIMEMPTYKMPRWSAIGLTILEKVKVFLFDAGKVIIAISIVLWVLSSHGPGDSFKQIEEKYTNSLHSGAANVESIMKAEKLEASYAGILGKFIEPAIAPLGFDWKIGISLITSFAAREVFVATMATIYSVGDEENTMTIKERMAAEINPKTGLPLYTAAVGFSLMLFYVFAMQCMSTLAVVYRETKHWKWPVIQFLYMSALAYFTSLLAFQLLS